LVKEIIVKDMMMMMIVLKNQRMAGKAVNL